MITLVELGAVCWVGAGIFQRFVLEPVREEHPDQHLFHQQVRERLRRVQLLAVLVLLFAHAGVLLGQALALTQGTGAPAMTPALLETLVKGSPSGLWWLVRVLLLLLAFRLLLVPDQSRHQRASFSHLLCWGNLVLGLMLLVALSLSSHAAALPADQVTVAVLVDWIHLLAAALWVGGMLTIALGYMPMLGRQQLSERATNLLTVLAYYSPWALLGVLLMTLTGPLSATSHFASWQQVVATAYGQVLLVKGVLVGDLVALSAYHVLFLRPRVQRAAHKYLHATTRLAEVSAEVVGGQDTTRWAGQVKRREARLAQPTRRLLTVLRLEPLLGVAILLCVGLMNLLGGTLVPATPTNSVPPTTASTQPYTTTLSTFDQRFQVAFTMAPKLVGTNHVQVRIADPRTGKAVTTVKVQLNTELLERDMGVAVVALTADGAGQFSGTADLAVSGTWRIIVQIQTPDDPYHFHEAYTDVALAS